MTATWRKFKPEDIYIEKEKDLPICFRFEENIKNKEVFGDRDIDLIISENVEFFSTKVKLKKLSQIALSEGLSIYIRIYADESNDLISEAFVDEEFDSDKRPIRGTELGVVRFFTKLF